MFIVGLDGLSASTHGIVIDDLNGRFLRNEDYKHCVVVKSNQIQVSERASQAARATREDLINSLPGSSRFDIGRIIDWTWELYGFHLPSLLKNGAEFVVLSGTGITEAMRLLKNVDSEKAKYDAKLREARRRISADIKTNLLILGANNNPKEDLRPLVRNEEKFGVWFDDLIEEPPPSSTSTAPFGPVFILGLIDKQLDKVMGAHTKV